MESQHIVYHGGKDTLTRNIQGIFFSDSREAAGKYGEISKHIIDLQNPYETDFEGNTWDEGDGWFSNIDAIAEYAKNEGYDGVIARNIRGNEEDKPRTDYVVFDLKHVKTNEVELDIDFQKALQLANNEYVGFAPHEISHGHCYEWAKAVKANFPDASIKDVDLWKLRGQSSLPYHVWIEYEGKVYDSETINGVNDFKNLPYFKTHKNQEIIPTLTDRNMP